MPFAKLKNYGPTSKKERFASQDVLDLANALRTGKVLLEFRMLRAFLVLWKDKIEGRHKMSHQQLANLAASIHDLSSRQLGPVEEKSSADTIADDKSYTKGYYLERYSVGWPSTLYDIFNRKEGGDIDFEKGPTECRNMWPDLEDELIPTVEQLKMMARDIRTARFDLEFRLLRAFVACWMTNPRQNYPFDHPERAEKMRKMALAQTGPENLITQDTGFITILRKEGDGRLQPGRGFGSRG
ncbi:hypothetical protein KCU71_g10444, partial [Aureobasidium melanogenum]